MVQDGLRRRNFKVYNLDVSNSTSGNNLNLTSGLNAATVTSTGDITVGDSIINNYENAEGVQITNIPAESVISGGMWVTGSAASGTTVSPVAIPGPASAEFPLGIALSTTASGANVPILTKGFYKGIVAEATLNAGTTFSAGAGTALNCAKDSGAGVTRGVVIMGGGSEATIGVYLF